MKKPRRNPFGDSTLALHAGENRFHVNAPVVAPLTRSTTFTFSGTEEMKRWADGKSSAYMYTRYANPTLRQAEEKIAALEGAEDALLLASGMAAISTTLLSLVGAGDELIATRQLYGGSYRFLRDVLPRLGVVVRHVENDLAGLDHLISPRTKALYIETPTNPTLRLVDIRKAAAFAQEWAIPAIVDNTFASPVLQKPLSVGFHLVVHSATKYLSGHSDVIAGAVAGNRVLVSKIRDLMINLGGSLDPEAAYLLTRGLKTLGVRVERQCKSAMAVAKFLEKHPKVARVHYPGLASHPDHALARRQMKAYGAMLAFDLKGGLPAARRFCDRVRIFLHAVSLGGVESLVVLPLYSSHYRMSPAELQQAGVSPGTVRVSVGLEDPADLLDDLRQALS
ncbi:MAG TPA: aminotransferase class I/II-fold pyridoxal phosphate-dependent enzyme [Verrucomicrobiae bacterium]|nr:aminotransferase class I/II-fold pyridoxal phosphate-dependent enzyme [Verrucomicrobiae bacterium]